MCNPDLSRTSGCAQDVEQAFSALQQAREDRPLVSRPVRWSEKYKSKEIQLSDSGREVEYDGVGTRMIRTDCSIPRSLGMYYYEVDVEVVEQDVGAGLQDSKQFGDIDLGFAFEPEWKTNFYHSYSGNFTEGVSNVQHTYGPTFGSGDTIGCGIDFTTDCYFFTKNGSLLGMISANLDENGALYPAVVICTPSKVKLHTNFGHKPFKAGLETVAEISSERAIIRENASKLPQRWCKYSAHPSILVSSDGREAELTKSIQLPTTPSFSWHEIKGAIVRTDFPIPPKNDSFYFEVEVLGLDDSSEANVGILTGSGDLNHMLGRSPFRQSQGSWGWCSHDGQLYCCNKTFPYASPFRAGDVIGCGIDLVMNQVFYSKNGVSLGPAFNAVGKFVDSGLYPAVSLCGETGAARINCGHAPFIYDIQAHLQQLIHLRTSAARIAETMPPELINRILDFVCDESGYTTQSERKQTVERCRLTCRYWNRRCRPLLFTNVTLTSLEELNTLLQLVTAPLDPLDIHHLLIIDSYPSWAYAGLAVLYGKLPNIESLAFKNREESDIKKLHRSHPPSLSDRLSSLFSPFQYVRMLYLTNLYFTSFLDIVHVVGRLSRLEVFIAEGLVWKRRLARVASLACQIKEIHVRECTDNTLFLSLLRMPCRPHGHGIDITPGKPALDVLQEDAKLVESIARLLITDSSPACLMKVFDNFDPSLGLFMDHGFVVDREYNGKGDVYAAFRLEYGDKDKAHALDSHISGVEIRLIEETVEPIQRVNWKQLDTLLTSLTHLKSITVSVGLPHNWGFSRSKTELEALAEQITKDMPESCRLCNLKVQLDEGLEPAQRFTSQLEAFLAGGPKAGGNEMGKPQLSKISSR